MKNNNTKIQTNVEGKIKYKLIDTRNGNVEQEGEKKNTLLYGYLNNFFSYGTPLLSNDILDVLHLGDGTAPADITQTGLQGTSLATVNKDSMVQEFDTLGEVPYGTKYLDETLGTDNLTAIAFSPDGAYFAVASEDYSVKVYETSTYTLINTFTGHQFWANSLDFSPDGLYIVSAGQGNEVIVWEYDTGNIIREFTGHTYYSYFARFNSDGTKVVSGGAGEGVKVWEVSTGNIILDYQGHSGNVNSGCFSPDDIYIATGGIDDTAKVIEVSSGNVLTDFTAHTNDINSIDWSADGNYIATISNDQTAKIWEYDTGNIIYDFQLYSNGNAVKYSPNNKFLFCGTSEGIKIWEIGTGSLINEINNSSINSIEFSSGGRFFGATENSNSFKVYKSPIDLITEKKITAKWIVEPGVGTGNINEVFVDASDLGPYYNAAVARQVLDTTIVKESYHQLEFEWTIKAQNPTGVYSGTITGGGRDGATNIDYKIFIGNMSFAGIVNKRSLMPYFGVSGNASAAGGTSNADSDLSLDAVVIGNSEGYVVPYEVTPSSYVADSLERSFTVGFNTDQLNITDGIGEIIFKDSNGNSAFRITFTPKLEKINTFRLYLDFTFSLNPA